MGEHPYWIPEPENGCSTSYIQYYKNQFGYHNGLDLSYKYNDKHTMKLKATLNNGQRQNPSITVIVSFCVIYENSVGAAPPYCLPFNCDTPLFACACNQLPVAPNP